MRNKTRRRVLLGLISLPITGVVRAAVRTPGAAEGPFYPAPAMRAPDIDNDLVRIDGRVTDAGGEIVHLHGRVLDRNGRPLAGARVEIWQCDVNGRYLHRGDRGGRARDAAFQGFGHDITGGDGGYGFRTIKPVPYPGRAPHIHVKVQSGGRELLTTQFYLADHPGNDGDFLYRRLRRGQREQVSMRFVSRNGVPTTRLDIIV